MIEPKAALQKRRALKAGHEGRFAHIRLDYNENLFGPSPKVVEAIRSMTSSEYSMYPEYGDFHRKLAQFLSVSEDEVLATNGSDEALGLLLQAFVERGEEVVVIEPTFEMFAIQARNVGANLSELRYKEAVWSFPVEELSAKLESQPKLVLIANPNNPTGTWLEAEVLERLIQKAPKTLFVIDEAYVLFGPGSALPLIHRYSNVVITQTFSKGHGLAALRIGYVVGQKEIIEPLKKVQLLFSVNKMAIVAAEAAIDDHLYALKCAAEIKKIRPQMAKELQALGFKVYPSEANFLLVNFFDRYSEVKEKLRIAHILVRDRGNEPLLNGMLRISIGPQELMEYLIKTLGVKKS